MEWYDIFQKKTKTNNQEYSTQQSKVIVQTEEKIKSFPNKHMLEQFTKLALQEVKRTSLRGNEKVGNRSKKFMKGKNFTGEGKHIECSRSITYTSMKFKRPKQ